MTKQQLVRLLALPSKEMSEALKISNGKFLWRRKCYHPLYSTRNKQRSRSNTSSIQQITGVPTHSPFSGRVSQQTIQSLHLYRWHNRLPLAHTQAIRSFESSTSTSAHLYPNVFWPPPQLSPSDGGDMLLARQCLSIAAAPEDTMRTDETQTGTAMEGDTMYSPHHW